MTPEYLDIIARPDGTWTADLRIVCGVRVVSGRVGHYDDWMPDDTEDVTIECAVSGSWEWPDTAFEPTVTIDDLFDLQPGDDIDAAPMVRAAVCEAVDALVCGVTA